MAINKKKLLNQKRLKEKKALHQEKIERVKKKYKDDPFSVIHLATKNSHPEDIYLAHKELAIKNMTEVKSEPSSRLIVGQEFMGEKIEVMASVAGIRTFTNKGVKTTRILLDRPLVLRKNGGKNQKPRLFDSHTWININDIQSGLNRTTYLSVGDVVLFNADVHEYRGQIEHYKTGYKYGLKNITNIYSGYPFYKLDRKAGTGILEGIKADYPRHGEWILKWKAPDDYVTQPIPDYLKEKEKYKGWIID